MNISEMLKLSCNPFPRIPVPSYPPKVTYDAQGIVDRILQEALLTHDTGATNALVIVGPYGSGKTHYMLAALAAIKNKFSNALPVYVPSPGSSILTVHKALIEALGPIKLASLAGDSDHGLDRILKLLNNEEYSGIVYTWLSGEAVEGKYRYKLGLGTKLDAFSSVILLSELISRFYEKEKGLCALFLDEIESILGLPVVKRDLYFASLRKLFDLAPRGLLVVLSATPAGWDAILSDAYALARRVSRNVIFLKPLTLDQARELLRLYLSSSGGKQDIFTDDAIEELCKASNGIVGELIKLAGLALDTAVSKGSNYVNREIVVEALSVYSGLEGILGAKT
jgi:type II secretory pathway predicted ATPase ExeA